MVPYKLLTCILTLFSWAWRVLFSLISNASEMIPFGTCACNRAFLKTFIVYDLDLSQIPGAARKMALISHLAAPYFCNHPVFGTPTSVGDRMEHHLRTRVSSLIFGGVLPKMRNIIIWYIGKIFVPLFSPFWTWIHISSKKFFDKGQGFFVIVRMNKQVNHCILCICLLYGHKKIIPYASKFGRDDYRPQRPNSVKTGWLGIIRR